MTCAATLAAQRGGPEAVVARVRDVGAVHFAASIRGRDGGFSARFNGRSVWVFGDTPLNVKSVDGSSWRSSTWAYTTDFDAQRAVALTEPLDPNGAPAEFLSFAPDELAYNAVHDAEAVPESARSRWRLWLGPIVVDPRGGKALAFYYKVMARNGPWAFESIGQSIAVWSVASGRPVRVDVSRDGIVEPPLFSKDDAPPATGALAVHDSLYTFRCRQNALEYPCILARVSFDHALNRRAWKFFAGGDRWTDDWHDAVQVMTAAPMLSVHWNAYLARYLAVYRTLLANTIEIRTATRVEGPWSASQVILTGRAPASKGAWDYCGVAHPELARNDGATEYVTYCRDLSDFASEIRVVEITLMKPGPGL